MNRAALYFCFLSAAAARCLAQASNATSNSTWYRPAPGTSFLWSLEEAIPANPEGVNGVDLSGLQVYDVDLFNATSEDIDRYHAAGKKVICYFSAGSYEPGRPDQDAFLPACYCTMTEQCKMDGWEEWWFDLNSTTCIDNVQTVMTKRLDLAVTIGCDGVEPDNTDSYVNDVGWNTTLDDEFSFLGSLSNAAHARNLSIALKNGPDMIGNRPAIVNMTDFVIIEECGKFDECDTYNVFVESGKAAFKIEYERDVECITPGFFSLSYGSYDVDYRNVVDYCPRNTTATIGTAADAETTSGATSIRTVAKSNLVVAMSMWSFVCARM